MCTAICYRSNDSYFGRNLDYHWLAFSFEACQQNEGAVRGKLSQKQIDQVGRWRCFRRLYLWLRGCGWRNDAFAGADVLSRLSYASGGRYKRVHYGVYGSYGRYQPFYDRRTSRCPLPCTVRDIYFALGENCRKDR